MTARGPPREPIELPPISTVLTSTSGSGSTADVTSGSILKAWCGACLSRRAPSEGRCRLPRARRVAEGPRILGRRGADIRVAQASWRPHSRCLTRYAPPVSTPDFKAAASRHHRDAQFLLGKHSGRLLRGAGSRHGAPPLRHMYRETTMIPPGLPRLVPRELGTSGARTAV